MIDVSATAGLRRFDASPFRVCDDILGTKNMNIQE